MSLDDLYKRLGYNYEVHVNTSTSQIYVDLKSNSDIVWTSYIPHRLDLGTLAGLFKEVYGPTLMNMPDLLTPLFKYNIDNDEEE